MKTRSERAARGRTGGAEAAKGTGKVDKGAGNGGGNRRKREGSPVSTESTPSLETSAQISASESQASRTVAAKSVRRPGAKPPAAAEQAAASSQATASFQAASSGTDAVLGQGVSADELNRRIAERAYHLFEERGRVHGFHLEDWLTAERQIRSAVLDSLA